MFVAVFMCINYIDSINCSKNKKNISVQFRWFSGMKKCLVLNLNLSNPFSLKVMSIVLSFV